MAMLMVDAVCAAAVAVAGRWLRVGGAIASMIRRAFSARLAVAICSASASRLPLV